MTGEKKVLIDIQDGLGIIKLNNLSKKNALDNETIECLIHHLDLLKRDDTIKVILLGSEGTVFCAGGDLKAMRTKTEMFAGDGIQLQKKLRMGNPRNPKTNRAHEYANYCCR